MKSVSVIITAADVGRLNKAELVCDIIQVANLEIPFQVTGN